MKMMKLVTLLSPLRFLGVLELHLLLALIAMSSWRSSFSRLAVAQTPNATTDPFEARLVNSIFDKLRLPPPTKWNISGELCSGTAIDSSDVEDLSPGLKCDCSYNSSTLCHITGLNINAMDVQGDLPEELWNLTFLTNLHLVQNYFTGPIPASIGQLTRMQYLILSVNALSGELPKELGRLTDLIELRLGTNNFSGSFPLELGNLTRLNHLFFDSSGISGVIPSSFARLQSLRYLWGSDTQLTGQIPDFIGNWSQLILLRLQGNSFQGSIPSSFSNLASLEELIVSDLSNASFSWEFIRNMTSLHTLVLRNNNISGSIPSSIGELQNLRHVDLSFNSLSGSIPDSLFNITGLTYLYLGTNKLTGSLPQQKGSSLQTIDLSYNELSGSFPSWVNDRNLQINLVANNFTLSDSFSRSLPSGLNCLQRNFPCNREFPIYYNFSIGCGSQALSHRSADGLRYWYEADNQTLGPATYYTTGSRRWAVSNVASLSFSDRQASFPPEYYFSAPSKVTNTLDSEIFQSGNASARFSTGSLRYYGLGLQNGNYIVNLQFAELQIQDGDTWRSLGRRVFDIYVQGNRVEQNFDIKKAAGGRSFTSVQKTYTAIVSENYLEIHLFWAGKGTCCVPSYGSYGPLISAISATPVFIPTFRKKDRTGLILRIVVPIGTVSLLSAFAVCLFIRRRKWRDMPEQEAFLGMDVRPYTFQYTELKEFLGMDVRPYTFEYTELKAATNDFHPTNKLGQGGFGPVFKGTLHDGRVVAIKQLSVASHQGKSQFVAEIATISVVQHRNLVKLHGCCIEGNKRLLVYEYHENKSLDKALFGTNSLQLDWPTRFDICLGVAKGLAYLHEESRLRIVHRDVKASNILLDSQLNPKISDFGLAKLYDDKMTHISTGVAGTIGYLAPEYAMWGQLTEKADVFGFGIVALEIVSGRPNSDTSLEEDKIYLLKWAWNLHENDHDIELVDPSLIEFKEEEVKRMIGVALLCTQNSPSMRPSMSRAVAMLYGDTEMPTVISRPSYQNDWRLADATRFMSCNHTESRDDTSRSMAADANYAPTNDAEPMLDEEMTRQGG